MSSGNFHVTIETWDHIPNQKKLVPGNGNYTLGGALTLIMFLLTKEKLTNASSIGINGWKRDFC